MEQRSRLTLYDKNPETYPHGNPKGKFGNKIVLRDKLCSKHKSLGEVVADSIPSMFFTVCLFEVTHARTAQRTFHASIKLREINFSL